MLLLMMNLNAIRLFWFSSYIIRGKYNSIGHLPKVEKKCPVVDRLIASPF